MTILARELFNALSREKKLMNVAYGLNYLIMIFERRNISMHTYNGATLHNLIFGLIIIIIIIMIVEHPRLNISTAAYEL